MDEAFSFEDKRKIKIRKELIIMEWLKSDYDRELPECEIGEAS